MRPDLLCVSYSSLSRPLGEVFPSLGLPQLIFSVNSRLHLDLEARQAERTDNMRSFVSHRRLLGGRHQRDQTYSAAGVAANAWPYRHLYSVVTCGHPAIQQTLTFNDYRIQLVALAPFARHIRLQ
jgi:hypothetical protein